MLKKQTTEKNEERRNMCQETQFKKFLHATHTQLKNWRVDVLEKINQTQSLQLGLKITQAQEERENNSCWNRLKPKKKQNRPLADTLPIWYVAWLAR